MTDVEHMIIQHDNDTENVLRAVARVVTPDDFTSGRVRDVLARMSSALAARDDGVALAAPQIGESLRIFIVAGDLFEHRDNNMTTDTKQHAPTDLVFINPQMTNRSKETVSLQEGCLSVAHTSGTVERSVRVTIQAQNTAGDKKTLSASGLLAQIFQHECDHLDGILFIDKAHTLHTTQS